MSLSSSPGKIGRFFGRVGIGMIATFVGLAIGFFDLANAAAFMILSIVCTAGISLVVWIPIWWVVGRFIQWVVASLSSSKDSCDKGPAESQPSRRLQDHEKAISTFIQKARAAKLCEADIGNRLLAAGWTAEEVDRGRKMIEGEK